MILTNLSETGRVSSIRVLNSMMIPSNLKRRLQTGDEYDSTDMPFRPAFCLASFIRQLRSFKIFFMITFICFAFSLFWIQSSKNEDEFPVKEILIDDVIENVRKNHRYSEVYRKISGLPKTLKYLLLWTRNDYAPFNYFGYGQKAFLDNNCSTINCYVTSDRRFFGDDLTKFDAILFNGRNINAGDLPYNRSSRQKYIYVNMESADNYPVCRTLYDDFFNWTSTYRLDSDIPYPYILVRNKKGEVIGPKFKMEWSTDMQEVDDEFTDRLANKSKAIAWFVSNCKTRSHRNAFVKKLIEALAKYGYSVDVYGKCGSLKCPRHKQSSCDELLSRDYYFYMALENSFAEDYVTEKLLTALNHDVVPVIYGGADYSRYLPPGSYLDGRSNTAEQLAATISRLINSPKDYIDFFKWKNHYTYSNPTEVENVCNLCEVLNNKEMFNKVSVYDHFRSWWYPNYVSRC